MDRANVKILGNDATTFAACFYNEKKVAEGKAVFLRMKNFEELEKYNIHSPVVLSRYFRKIADRNSQVVHPQKHIMFSLPGKPTEEDKQRLLELGIKVLEDMGYAGQPMVFWGHLDSGHYHIHSATVTVNKTTGEWINNYCEGIKARRILDKLLGYNKKDKLENLLQYKFESREQFLNLLRAVGYRQSYYNSELGVVHVRRAQEVLTNFTDEEINNQIEATGKNKDNEKDRIKQLKGIILDHRRRSMDYLVDDPEVVKTKKGKKHTATDSKKGVKGAAFDGQNALGEDIKGIRKAQFKQFLEELKEKFGLSVVFSKWDGEVKGYTIVDNNKKIVFKGSDIMPLEQLLNPEWRKGQEKGTVISSNEAAHTVDVIESEKIPDDEMAYLDEEPFDRSTIRDYELAEYIIEECDRNYVSTNGIYSPNLDDLEMTVEEAREKALYLLDKAIYENDNGDRKEAEKTADAAVAYANYVAMGKKKKQIIKPTPMVTQKPVSTRPAHHHTPVQTEPTIHEKCLDDIENARNIFENMFKEPFSRKEILEENIIGIAKGIVARGYEEKMDILHLPTLELMSRHLINEIEGYTPYKNNVYSEVRDNVVKGYLGMILSAMQSTGVGSGGNNDLPMDSDDKYRWWQNMFNMFLPRRSSSQSQKTTKKR